MKKIIYLLSLLLVFTLIIVCVDKLQDIKYESASITSRFERWGENGREVEFSDEDVSEFLAMLNNSEWNRGIIKYPHTYALYLDGDTLYYLLGEGVINDKDNYRHIFLSEEERAYLNSLLCGKINYESASITARFGNAREMQFSDEEVSGVLNILNNSEWKLSITKTAYEYILYLDGNTLYYTFKQGIINDKENDRHIFLSEEERVYLNSIIFEQIKYDSSSVCVRGVDVEYGAPLKELAPEDAEAMLSMWNSAEWYEIGEPSDIVGYVFILSDSETEIYYSRQYGYFVDPKNHRSWNATIEQQEYINKVLDRLYR